jgi:membrane protein implicated in regulation of membrane protease activity
MIWIFLAVFFGAITFTSLGIMTVKVSILTMTLKAMLFLCSGGLLYVLWRYLKSRRDMKTHRATETTEIRRIA